MDPVTTEKGFSNQVGDDFDPTQWANDVTNTPTANKAYNDYVKTGGKKSFKDWLTMAQEKGWFDKALDLTKTILGNRAGANTGGGGGTGPTPPAGSPVPSTKILGMPPVVAGIVGVLVLAGVIYGVYRIAK